MHLVRILDTELQDFRKNLQMPELSLGLARKAGVGGIGRSRVETYSLDFIFLYSL